MSNDNEVFARIFKLLASICKMVVDGKRDAQMVADYLQKIVDEPKTSVVIVDRLIRPTYPDWVKNVLYPEIENTGPSEFDVSSLEQWLHDNQKTGIVTGNIIHEHFKSNNMLQGCLGLRDLEEIQKKGVMFFREHFNKKAVFGWKSIVRVADSNLFAPYLIELVGRVVLRWGWLGRDWVSDSPALRFAS